MAEAFCRNIGDGPLREDEPEYERNDCGCVWNNLAGRPDLTCWDHLPETVDLTENDLLVFRIDNPSPEVMRAYEHMAERLREDAGWHGIIAVLPKDVPIEAATQREVNEVWEALKTGIRQR